MSKNLEFLVDSPNMRLDVFLAQVCGISRSYVQKLITGGHVSVNNKLAKTMFR